MADKDSSLSTAQTVFAPLLDPSLWPVVKVTPDDPSADHPKDPACYVSEFSRDLGPYIRLLVALRLLLRLAHPQDEAVSWAEFLKKHGSDFRRTLMTCLKSFAPEHTEELGKEFNSLFRRDKSGWRPVGSFLERRRFSDCLLGCLTEKLDRPTPLEWTQFLEVVNKSPHAKVGLQTIHRFEQWLKHGVHPAMDDVSDLQCERLVFDRIRTKSGEPPEQVWRIPNKRHEQIKRIRGALNDLESGMPLLNVYSSSNRTGLRALATYVLQDQYLLRKSRADEHRQPALIYIPIRELSAEKPRTTREVVLTRLRRCFGLDEPIADSQQQGSVGISDQIAELRRALSIHPTILIFDGVEVNAGSMSAVLDYIQDAHWEDFLRVLLQPHQQTLRKTGQPYQSKFLVLSNRRLKSLLSWTSISEPFRAPANPETNRLLVEHPERVTKGLELQRIRIGAPPSALSADGGVALDKLQLDLLFENPAFVNRPTEQEIVLAGLLNTEDFREIVLSTTDARVGQAVLHSRLTRRWLERHDDSTDSTAAIVIALLIVASVDGIRLATLARTAAKLMRLVGASSIQSMRARRLLEDCISSGSTSPTLFQAFPGLFVYRTDQDVVGLGPEQHLFELSDLDPDPISCAIDPTDRRLIDVRLPELRQLMYRAMSKPSIDPHPDTLPGTERKAQPEPTWWGQSRTGLWSNINRVLAEESLRQATVQLRNLDSRFQAGPYGRRRLVQAIYHGLLSYSLREEQQRFAKGRSSHPRSALTNEEATKDFRHLYSFLFRDCLENAPEWILGRWLGRTELRFQLLCFFAAPDLVSRGAFDGVDASREASLLTDAIKLRREVHLQDPALYLDLLEALGRAAYDTGRHAIVDRLVAEAHGIRSSRDSQVARELVVGRQFAVTEPLRLLNEAVNATQRALFGLRNPISHDPVSPSRKAAAIDFDDLPFHKLQIDSLQARGELEEAWDQCTQWLAAHLPAPPDLKALGRTFVFPTAADEMSGREKSELEEHLHGHVIQILDACHGSRDSEAIADMLARAGEILATEADARADWQDAGPEFIGAYAVYWVADRVRSGAAGFQDTMRWPKVSARPMRYYVRVSLKIARVLAQRARPDSGARKCALTFFEHARDRLNTYSRHLYRLPRERLAMLLLLAATARLMNELGARVEGEGLENGPDSRQPSGLSMSLEYIDRAESLAIDLGLPLALTFRLFFERIKTTRRMMESGTSRNDAQLLVRDDLKVLKRLAEGSAFWSELVRRQELAMQLRDDAKATRIKGGSPFGSMNEQLLKGTKPKKRSDGAG